MTLQTFCTSIHDKAIHAVVADVFSQDPFEVILMLKKGNEEIPLLISTDKKLARFHLVTKPVHKHPPSFAKELKGYTLTAIVADKDDPIVRCSFKKNETVIQLITELSIHPRAFLVDQNQKVLFATTDAKELSTKITARRWPCPLEKMEEWAIEEKERTFLEEEKKRLQKRISQKITSFEKSLERAKVSLQESQRFDEARHMADLVKAHYANLKKGMTELLVQDWEKENQEIKIPIDPKQSPKEVLEKFFKKSQKLERAIVPLSEHIEKLSIEYKRLLELQQILDSIRTKEALIPLKSALGIVPKSLKTLSKRASPYHIYHSESGMEILVGKNSESNHTLTFQVAHGHDLWLHAHAVSGAHVVVRNKKKEDIDSETLQDALQLALHYSKAKNQRAYAHEVLVTERKYVSRTPTAPKGRVLVSKHKIITAVIDADRFKKITTRYT